MTREAPLIAALRGAGANAMGAQLEISSGQVVLPQPVLNTQVPCGPKPVGSNRLIEEIR